MSGVSADPEEQLGAKNSISPKNDLRSFSTNVTYVKLSITGISVALPMTIHNLFNGSILKAGKMP